MDIDRLIQKIVNNNSKNIIIETIYKKKINKLVNNKNIIMFHEPTTTFFIESLKVLTKNFKIISLDDLILSNKSGNKEKEIAITFDDGGKSIYYNVYPIVKKYKIPIVVYLVTETLLDENYKFWWKKDDKMINADYKIDYDKLKKMNYLQRDIFIDEEKKKGGYQNMGGDGLSKNMLNEMLKDNNIIFGSHTAHHVNLKIELEDVIQKEIGDSKKIMENFLNRKIDHFAYPYGEYNKSVMQIVEKFGYKSAVTTENKWLKPDISSYCIPRVSAGPNNGSAIWLKYHTILSK